MERLSDAEFQRLHRQWIASQAWKDFRRTALAHYHFRCAICGFGYTQSGISKWQLIVDHRRYWSDGTLIFGRETCADVRLLCPGCNRKGIRSDASIRRDRTAYRWHRAILWLLLLPLRLLWWLLRRLYRSAFPGD